MADYTDWHRGFTQLHHNCRATRCAHARDALGDITVSDSRFWAKVNKTENCWFWTGSTTPDGYGRLMRGNRGLYAHRVAYESTIGIIGEGLELDHLCRVRNCVNPTHLNLLLMRLM